MRTLLLVLALAACSKHAQAPAQPPPPASGSAPEAVHKDPKLAKQMIAQGAVVLDVRTPDEFNSGHLPTATNIPIDDFAKHLDDVAKLTGGDKSKPIVVHCGGGARAERAKRQLEAAGYTHVVNGGGYDDLK